MNGLWLLGMAGIVFGAFGLCALFTVPSLQPDDDEAETDG